MPLLVMILDVLARRPAFCLRCGRNLSRTPPRSRPSRSRPKTEHRGWRAFLKFLCRFRHDWICPFFCFRAIVPFKVYYFFNSQTFLAMIWPAKNFYPFLVLKSSRKKDLFCRNILLKTMGRERSPSSSSEEERSSKKRSKRSRRTRSRSRDRRRRHGGSDRHHHRRRRYSTSSESSGSEQRAGRKEVERLADLERRKAQEDKKVEEETNRYRRCWSCYQYS